MIKINLKNKRKGFTLVEVLIAFFTFLILLDGAWVIYKNTLNSNDFFIKNLNAQSEARIAFEKISASIRSASISSLGAYPIAAASSTAFVFYSDVNGDGLKERVRYFFSGNNLKEGILIPSGSPLSYVDANEKISTLVRDVARSASSSFSFYDSNYDGTTAPLPAPVNILSIRLVKIIVTVDADPTKSPGPMTFTTQVSIRNLKDNL